MRFLRIFCFVVVGVTLTFSQHQRDSLRLLHLSNVARGEMRGKNVPGVAVAVVSGDKLVYAQGAGILKSGSEDSATADALFRLGSTTKMFVAAAAMQLVDRGDLGLHTPIGTYAPKLREPFSTVTMHELLSHTAGLFDDFPMMGDPDDGALERQVLSWEPDQMFLEPGMFFSYSNPGYWLAGYVMEQASGMPFADVMRTAVFEPLGMGRSTFRPEVAYRYPTAAPHDRDTAVITPPPNHAGTWPSGSMYSSARDVSRFLIAMCNEGMLDGKRVLPAAGVKAMLTPAAKVLEKDQTSYGYGIILERYRDEDLAWHNGGRIGYGSVIRIIPAKKVGVVVLGNRTSSILSTTAEKALGFAAELAPKEDDAGVWKRQILTADADPYIGTYVGPPHFEIELVTLGILHMKQGLSRIPVEKIGENRYTNSVYTFSFSDELPGDKQYMHIEMHTLRRIQD
jgi:CubicO group peptidase (beta-lactamase class C family)